MVLIVLGLAVAAAACTKQPPKTPVTAPAAPTPLNVPAPPALVMTPVPLDTVETAATVDPVVPTSQAKPTPPQTSKPPAQTATPPAVPPPPPVIDPPPPVIQTTRTPEDSQVRAQADIIRTQQLLAGVNRDRLPPLAQPVYDESQRFLRMAVDDMKNRDFAGAAANAAKARIHAEAVSKGGLIDLTAIAS